MRNSLDSTKEGRLRQYRVMLHGRLGPAPPGSDVQPAGFYVNRIVSAHDLTDAGRAAIQRLCAEPKYIRMVTSYGGRSPELTIAEISPSHTDDEGATNRTGYIFYETDNQ